MAERGTAAQSGEPTWSSNGAPESSLEALAASWRQSGVNRAAAGAARVDSGQVDMPSVSPPMRGRAEVRSPYADLLGPPPGPPQPAPAQSPANSNGAGGYPQANGSQPSLAEQATNGNGTHYVQQGPGGTYFSADSPTGETARAGYVTAPGSPAAVRGTEYPEPPAAEAQWAPSYQQPSQQVYYQQPMYYQEPRHEEPRYEEPRYEEPRYEEPRYEESRHAEHQYQPGQYQPGQYHQYAQPAPPQAPPQHQPVPHQMAPVQAPTHQPPTHQAPSQQPPTHQPPTHQAPSQQPPTHHELARPEPAWHEALPQRVPAAPDVPEVPDDEVEEPVVVEVPAAETPELARIATKLREDEDEEQQAPPRPDGFDIPAVLAAVRGVPGVRDAQVRPSPGGVHTLRLELADDADPARISREVARLLKVKMGLAAEPNEGSRRSLRPVASTGTGAPAGLAGERPAAAPVSGGGLSPGRDVRRRHPVSGRRAEVGRAEPVSDIGRIGGLAPVSGIAPVSDIGPVGGRGPEPERAAYSAGGETGVHATLGSGASRPLPGGPAGARVVLDQVEVSTQGLDAVVQVRLITDGRPSYGVSSGPAVDGYVTRLSAVAAASALDEMLVDADGTARARCFVEHAAVVPLGSCEVAVVVLLLVCGGWVEQLTGSALVGGDPRQAMVRATLAAVNRRLESLLP